MAQGTHEYTAAELAKYIDHTLLKPEATPDQIARLCAEARQYGFASVCVNPCNVHQAAALLTGTDVAVCSVIGFPFGATTPEAKAFEAKVAIQQGAGEVDMVINIGALKGGDDDLVLKDIQAVVRAAHRRKAIAKVIIETALLTEEEKVRACRLVKKAKADFVKTSTGFSTAGATLPDVQLMRRTVGRKMGIKAAGGIRDYETAKKMIAAGATRIGASSSVKMVQEAAAR
jgi:deoxyribose-phosphate aldolase